MASLVSELFYESSYNPNSFEDSTFLSTRSMRNFLNDCYCVLASFNEKDENYYTINRKIIKDRLAPDDISSSIKKDDVISIKTDSEDKVIFKKNTLYGVKKNDGKKQDHLYQENICNLYEVIDENKSREEFKDIQRSFYDFFNYINNDIPFFKFLIDEANFLGKIRGKNATN